MYSFHKQSRRKRGREKIDHTKKKGRKKRKKKVDTARKITEDLRQAMCCPRVCVANVTRFVSMKIPHRDRTACVQSVQLQSNVLGIDMYTRSSMRLTRPIIKRLILSTNPWGYLAPPEMHCLAAPCLVQRQRGAIRLCAHVEREKNKSLPHAMPKVHRALVHVHPIPNRALIPSDHSNTSTAQRSSMDDSLRAAARIARSLPELLLRVGLLLQLRNASAPRVDEPIADLFATVSPFAPPRTTSTHLSHCETGAAAEHLLLFFGRIGMGEVLLEPLFEHIRNIPRKVASSLLWHLRRHVLRFELHRPVVPVRILTATLTGIMPIVTGGYLIVVRGRAVRRARGMVLRRS